MALLLAASLAACGTDSGSSGGSSSSTDSARGLTLRVTNAPFDSAVRVDVWFDSVGARQAGGGWIDIPIQQNIVGLASLQGTRSLVLVSDFGLPPGDYTELRFIVDETKSEIEIMGGGVYPLAIPSGASSGLKLKGDFTIFEDKGTELVADFDLRRGIVGDAAGGFRLVPPVRMVSNGSYGHIRGKVDGMLLVAGSCSDALADTYNAAYIFAGPDATPNDINAGNNGNDPITTTKIYWDDGIMSYVYEAGFLPAGDYTVALTCNADQDDLMKANDNLYFFGVKNATVSVNDVAFF